ncbi:BirA family transcriptional regulator, biotin operon repressor / biotin---[acetyl-CoA-carboxylase] ligase [Candidatus Hakubella thermalkaliphila]|uniref:biotin--[biotin carboxyl-carrier protein] ligase n=1 Tax=Candidatus Hakubella thermalkaliphila TaxID=2754717 RepID=A0A6V8PV59_9ACTN|nr:biotin--[acetyl-CoA-carboxylase] ligase [Candidatus Hakubella thermalkaliphila]GFP28188.1 BirA family transcriptional regulator, biotin operon repressor / biotin---[acetyl-CoA-carboxylase] ligase [Candidatus Hakubella thermalkaliphila]GFP34641.1 BirA family transcriptional regulator, biotin operon repressor / biotin---[acetyl-CoA-carboxylase] ligase [Candidatus Hakubella thermalkaliphila]
MRIYSPGNQADREILFLQEVGSTNDYARKLFQKGCAAGTVVVARRQTGGKGRRGRSWSSPEGGLWFSLILPCRPEDSSVHKVPLIISLSVAQAVEERCGVKTELKWPNDVLIGGKKIAGILIERGTRDTGEEALLVGIGINVNLEQEVLQREGIQEVATSLDIVTGREEDLYALLLSVLDKIEENLHNLYYNQGDLLGKFTPRMSILGQMVAVQLEGDTIYGRASGLTQEGALVIQAGKRTRTLYSGDVVSLRLREDS